MDKSIKCPCCGLTKVREHDICDVCEWQNDLVQLNDPTYSGGANQMSLNEARATHASGEPVK